MEVIFRNDIVEQARAGDKLVFCGNLVVVPDVSVITAPGQRNIMKGAGAGEAYSGSPSPPLRTSDATFLGRHLARSDTCT